MARFAIKDYARGSRAAVAVRTMCGVGEMEALEWRGAHHVEDGPIKVR